MIISNFIAYAKQAWKNKPDTSTPLSAARLTHLEEGIKSNSDAIEKIAAAVVSQIVNDPNKIASMASLYSVNQTVAQLNSDLDVQSITDWHSITKRGFYLSGRGATNAPDVAECYGMAFVLNYDWVTIIAKGIGGGPLMIKIKSQNRWTPWEQMLTTSDLRNTVKFSKPSGITSNAYSNAMIYLEAPYRTNDSTRACIGFNNESNNAGTLYLDIDGRLKFMNHMGEKYTLTWS